MISSDIIWYHLISSDIIWYHLIPSDIIWYHLISSDIRFFFQKFFYFFLFFYFFFRKFSNFLKIKNFVLYSILRVYIPIWEVFNLKSLKFHHKNLLKEKISFSNELKCESDSKTLQSFSFISEILNPETVGVLFIEKRFEFELYSKNYL